MQLAIVIFTVEEGKLKILMRRDSLPATTVAPRQSLDDQASELFLQVSRLSSDAVYFSEQLYTFSFPIADRPLVISYYFLLPWGQIVSAIRSQFISVERFPIDHQNGDIIRYAVQRLRWKIEYTNVVYSLLQQQFTLSELQQAYEAILGRSLDKRNFRKKILLLKLLKPIGKTRKSTAGRGAQLYAFRFRQPVWVKVF